MTGNYLKRIIYYSEALTSSNLVIYPLKKKGVYEHEITP